MAILNAVSTSRQHVGEAVAAAQPGDTVVVPAGSSVWSTTLVIDKSITLQGQSNVSRVGDVFTPDNQTIITDGTTQPGPSENMILAGPPSTGAFRITGFTFQGQAATNPNNRGMVTVGGTNGQIRIDHNNFIVRSQPAIHTNGYVRGVIDHNYIDSSLGQYSVACYSFHDTWDIPGSNFGDASWNRPSTLGTADAIFYEDNFLIYNQPGFILYAFDGWMGCRRVIRYNVLSNIVIGDHGTESGGRWRGHRHSEIYGNKITFSENRGISSCIGSRGGTNMVFDNQLSLITGGFINQFADMVNYRGDPSQGTFNPWSAAGIKSATITSSGTTATVTTSVPHRMTSNFGSVTVVGASPAGYNGTFRITSVPSATTLTYTLAGALSSPATGTITIMSPWDQNTESTGYLALDQPGASRCDLISGTDPSPIGWPNQTKEPIYYWNNTQNGSTNVAVVAQSGIVENRDFYKHNANFIASPTSGVGVGTLANRPTSGMVAGVGYFATNTGKLYVATSSTTWVEYYTPYTYPHPLVGGAAAPSRKPIPTVTTRRVASTTRLADTSRLVSTKPSIE